jgi:hypothetical protein
MEEAMTILKAAAHTFDQHMGLSFHGPPTIAQLTLEPSDSSLFTSHNNADPLTDFADYCLDNMEPTSSEPMVSFIKRFQNRSRETGPAEPCKHAACSRTHPVNECCIYRGPHFVHQCWHVLGLPDGIAAIKDNFVKQHVANDGPWKCDGTKQRTHNFRHNGPPPRHQDRSRVSAVQFEDQTTSNGSFKTYLTVVHNSVAAIQPRHPRQGSSLTQLGPMSTGATTIARNTNGSQSATQDTIDIVQEDPLQGYRSPLVNRFIEPPDVSSIVFPVVLSIVTEQSQHLLRPLPQDGPAIDVALLDDLYHDHMVSRVSMVLQNRKEIKRSDYVWFHLDTGATCTVSHCPGESHCPTSTTVKCGTAADGPSHVVKSLGYLMLKYNT